MNPRPAAGLQVPGEPADAIADAELPGLTHVIQIRERGLRHRLAIRIPVHQNGILTHGHIQVCHLHQHILVSIHRFLGSLHLAQRAADLLICLPAEAQQIHAGCNFAPRGIIQFQHRFATPQHAGLPDLHLATGERGGSLQHLAAARCVPTFCFYSAVQCVFGLGQRIVPEPVPAPLAGTEQVVYQFAPGGIHRAAQRVIIGRGGHLMSQFPGIHLHGFQIGAGHAQAALPLQRQNDIRPRLKHRHGGRHGNTVVVSRSAPEAQGRFCIRRQHNIQQHGSGRSNLDNKAFHLILIHIGQFLLLLIVVILPALVADDRLERLHAHIAELQRVAIHLQRLAPLPGGLRLAGADQQLHAVEQSGHVSLAHGFAETYHQLILLLIL